jgi:hypothetical protein
MKWSNAWYNEDLNIKEWSLNSVSLYSSKYNLVTKIKFPPLLIKLMEQAYMAGQDKIRDKIKEILKIEK